MKKNKAKLLLLILYLILYSVNMVFTKIVSITFVVPQFFSKQPKNKLTNGNNMGIIFGSKTWENNCTVYDRLKE